MVKLQSSHEVHTVMSARKILDTLLGILLLFGGHAVYLGIAYALLMILGDSLITALWPNDSYAGLGLVIGIILAMGLIQFAYAAPLYRYFKRQARPSISFGIAIAVGFTLFVTGGWIITVFAFRN